MGARKERRSAQVPGSFLGFSLQTTRATVHLLEAQPGSMVSVEVLDDVAVTTPKSDTKLEQAKSGVTRNPISDRSIELWKTLANWVRAAANDIDATKTRFEIWVSKKYRGQISYAFHDATNRAEAANALRSAKETLWGVAPAFPKRAKVAATLAPHLDVVLTAPAHLVETIIERLSLTFGSGASAENLMEALRRKIISDNMLDIVAHWALGWVKSSIDERLERNEPAAVSTDEFNKQLAAFVRKVDRFAILYSFAANPPQSAVDLEVQGRNYVRQLEIIGSDYDSMLEAANDFLRAAIDRSDWAKRGLVDRSSFDEFENVLTRHWKAKKDIVSIVAKGETPEASGRMLYSECSILQAPLEGRAVPPHFIPGCFHALSDNFVVGWHPDYRTVLKPSDPVPPEAET
jgi:hypothetical protein